MGLALGLAMIVGVAAGRSHDLPEALVIAACIAVLGLLLAHSHGRLAIAAIVGLMVGFGTTSIRGADTGIVEGEGRPIQLSGTVTSDPRLAGFGRSAWLSWESGAGSAGEALIFFSTSSDVGRGDRVAVEGEWSDTVEEFFFVEKIEVTGSAGTLERTRRSLRNRATSHVLARVPGSNGSLALGLIIGDDSGLTSGERDDLRASGLSHITAVSGSNVALVIVAVAFILQALGKRSWIWIAGQFLGIVFYVWIVGADPPILRAAIMGSLVLVAGAIGRPSHLYTLLFVAGGAMCLLDPDILSSLAFQLSFLSMTGLALAGDVIARANGRRRKVIAAVLSPAAAAIATAPLLAGHFGTFSPGTLPANVFVAPVIAPATGLSALVAVLPADFVTGALAGYVLWGLTEIILLVSAAVASLPYSLLRFAPFSNEQIVACYLLLGMLAAPFIPEAKLAAHNFRVWTMREPVVAAPALATAAVMLGALIVAFD